MLLRSLRRSVRSVMLICRARPPIRATRRGRAPTHTDNGLLRPAPLPSPHQAGSASAPEREPPRRMASQAARARGPIWQPLTDDRLELGRRTTAAMRAWADAADVAFRTMQEAREAGILHHIPPMPMPPDPMAVSAMPAASADMGVAPPPTIPLNPAAPASKAPAASAGRSSGSAAPAGPARRPTPPLSPPHPRLWGPHPGAGRADDRDRRSPPPRREQHQPPPPQPQQRRPEAAQRRPAPEATIQPTSPHA